MPVRFEQPAPLAPGITAGAGAAQQYSRDLPSLVSLYNNLLNAGRRGGGGAQARNPFPGGVGGNRLSGGAPGIGGGGGQQQQSEPLNQAEKIRLSRLQAGLASIDADPELTPQQKQQYKLQFQAGINPLLQRQQAAKAQMMEEQLNQMKHANAAAATMKDQDAQMQAKSAMSRVNWFDPEHTVGVFTSMDGKEHLVKRSPPKDAQLSQELAERKARQTAWHQAQQAAISTLGHKKDEQNNPVPPDENEVRELAKRYYAQSPEGKKENEDFWKAQGPGAVPGGPPAPQAPALGQGAPRAPVSPESRKIIQDALKKHMPEFAEPEPREDMQTSGGEEGEGDDEE